MINSLSKHTLRPLSILQTELIYESNLIDYKLADLYLTFLLKLDALIDSTYLGHDLLNEGDRLNHFKWCWDKICENPQYLNFSDSDDLYINLLDLYLEAFYNDKSNKNFNLEKYWIYVFNYKIEKNKFDIDNFIFFYKLFDNYSEI